MMLRQEQPAKFCAVVSFLFLMMAVLGTKVTWAILLHTGLLALLVIPALVTRCKKWNIWQYYWQNVSRAARNAQLSPVLETLRDCLSSLLEILTYRGMQQNMKCWNNIERPFQARMLQLRTAVVNLLKSLFLRHPRKPLLFSAKPSIGKRSLTKRLNTPLQRMSPFQAMKKLKMTHLQICMSLNQTYSCLHLKLSILAPIQILKSMGPRNSWCTLTTVTLRIVWTLRGSWAGAWQRRRGNSASQQPAVLLRPLRVTYATLFMVPWWNFLPIFTFEWTGMLFKVSVLQIILMEKILVQAPYPVFGLLTLRRTWGWAWQQGWQKAWPAQSVARCPLCWEMSLLPKLIRGEVNKSVISK